MHWKKSFTLLALLTTLLALLVVPVTSYAQDYSFSMDQETVDVFVNQDGSVSLEYWFVFTCDPGAHPIDVVDVGMPNSDYRLSDVSADVNEKPVSTIEQSEFVKPGVAVWLGEGTINPGETGMVHVVVGRVGGMVYEDSSDSAYASAEFSPTWYDSQYVHGTTDLTVRFHLPPGIKPEEPRWHRSPSNWPQEQPDTALDKDGRVLYTWHNPTAAPDRQYTFGASFPIQYVAEGAIKKGPSALEALFGTVLACLGGTLCNPVFLFIAGFAGLIGLSIWGQRKRRMQYLPPSMKVEGVGIKRGLTAVESAILLETPLDRVLTMILFGLLKKGAVTVLSDNPLKIELNQPLPEDLYPYEKGFVEAVAQDGTLGEKKLQPVVVDLVKEVNNKMKGFSRKETAAYYRDIVQRAWQQVETADTPEVRGQRFDEQLQWTMLDDKYEDRMGRTFTQPIFVPLWWNSYRPWASARSTVAPAASARPAAARAGTPARPDLGRVQLPTLPGATFAATMVRGVQGTASRIVRNVTGFTSGVTQTTNPPPAPSPSGRSYGGGGGGRSCACACACAGCACACAGGGR